MLSGIDPLLTGDLLLLLDHMGHGDTVLIADAHYPVYSMGSPVVEVNASAPEVLRAIRTVIPVDDYEGPSVSIMQPDPGEALEVGDELRTAARCAAHRLEALERFAFYERARGAFFVARSAESRKYGNALLRKGVVGFSD
ncbi:MAG: transport protein RbsD/FucU [Leifsonia sp.]|nr:transport protein RbsD/FucU [Leifsonia sp.]